MKILVVTADNFSSYKDLIFKADRDGLTLISGPTGSGKSALCDLIPWVLFGITAKGGTADEVISWNADGVTQCTAMLLVNDSLLSVVRRRAPGKNDLFFYWGDKADIRGKDLKDTQKLLNNILGMNADIYLSGAYFHEFCTSASFFTTTAKNRREITEQIVDLSLHKRLVEKSKESLKQFEKIKTSLTNDIANTEARVSYLTKALQSNSQKAKEWQAAREFKLADLKAKAITFDEDMQTEIQEMKSKAKVWDVNNKQVIDLASQQLLDIDTQPGKCPECGGPIHIDPSAFVEKYKQVIKHHESLINPYLAHIIKCQMLENTYSEQANALELEENPHGSSLLELEGDIAHAKKGLQSTKDKRGKIASDIADLELLLEVVDNFRAVTVRNTILQLEDKTNSIISEHFDGEIRVNFTISGDDKLDVALTKDGNSCSYTQLSKGQRQVLKLSFGVAVMDAVSNQHGIKFEQLFFDESLDGLDDSLKIKAINLFEKLTTLHNSVYIVEHSESVKAMVNNKLKVSLVNGESQLEEA